jgi:DNA mismatch endonuclease (patch repair protein)
MNENLTVPLPAAPTATTPEVAYRMQQQQRKHTKCEVEFRKALHGLGLRYRVDAKPIPCFRRKADVVFRQPRIAVFVDGCFWHGCPTHFEVPHANDSWWALKIERNRARDRDTTAVLEQSGWTVLRFWEHEDLKQAARLVAELIYGRKRYHTLV